MMEDSYLLVLINHSQMISQIVRPENLNSDHSTEIPCVEYLLELQMLVTQGRWNVKVSMNKLFEGAVVPDQLLPARESILEATDIHHDEEPRS